MASEWLLLQRPDTACGERFVISAQRFCRLGVAAAKYPTQQPLPATNGLSALVPRITISGPLGSIPLGHHSL